MRISGNLRRLQTGPSGSIPFAPVQAALAASALLLVIGGLSLALVTHVKSHSPAPAFLSAALGERSASPSSASTTATRTFAKMRTSVVRRGVRVAAPWAHAELSSLDAGTRPWTPYAAGAVRTTAFGTEAVTLAGISAEEFLTVEKRQGIRTWRWTLDSRSRPRVTPAGGVEFVDAHGRPVLMSIAAPSILDAHGRRLAAGPLHWRVTTKGDRSLLTLRLDDTNLPVPYTIDPAITLTASAYTVVKGAGHQTGTFSLNVPSGTQTGDLLVVQFVVRTASAMTTPSGWTLLASQVDTTDGLAQYMYTHIATSTDTAGSTVFTMTTPASTDAAGGVVALRNVDASPTNPAQASSSGNANNTTATATVTTDSFVGSNNDYVMAFYGGMGQIGFTETNTSMSPVWTASSENQMPNGSGQYTTSNSNVSSGSSGASRADSLVTAGSFGAGVSVTPSATLSSAAAWIMNVLAFRVALPWNQVVPTITGTVGVGQTLTAGNGTWSNTPTGYTYQWERCDTSGANCVAISGATAQTYVPTSTDSGSTLVVEVTASNANGTGQMVSSAATSVVPAGDGSGTLTTATSSVTAGSTGNTIAFTYTAPGAPISAGKVQLTIPAGWTAPSTASSNAGYTTASTGSVAVAGQVVTVSNVTLAANATMTITYGSRAGTGAGATAATIAGPQTWSAAQAATSSGTITALAASPSITVNPGAAAKVAWTQQPSATGAGSSISPSPTASIEDTYGNVVTTSTATVAAAIGTNPGGGTLSGTTSVSAVNGVATFSNLSINKTGTGYTLVASSTGLTSATSSAFNITVGAPSKIAFVQGPTNVAAGSSISPSVTVAVQDAAGNTVTTSTAPVSIAIGTNPSGGTLSGTATVNAVNGIATFSTLSIDKSGTGYTLAASSTGLTGTTSGTFNVSAGTASKLAFVQGPTTTTAGVAISPAVTVAITDAYGNATSSTASVTIAIGTNPGGGTLSGTATANAVAGTATFSNLSIDKGGTGYTLTASSTGLTGTTSSAFNINVAAVSSAQSTVSASPASLIANGVSSSTVTVTAKDAFGNPVSGQTVTLAQGTGSSTITTVSGTTNASGQASFTVTDTKAETVTYTATVGSTGVLQTAAVTFTAGTPTAAQSTVAASPTSVTANGTTSSTVTVTLKDANSNPVAGKTVTLGKSGGSSTITTVSGTTNASGQATFTVKDTAAEQTTYTATDSSDSLTLTQTATVTFTAGTPTAAQSTAVASPTSVTADGTTTSTITVTLKDANSNPVAGKTVTLAKSGGSSTITTLSGTTNASGQATFTVKDTTAEQTTYTATDTTDTLTLTQQPTVTFTAGTPTAASSSLTASPGSVTADGSSTSTATVTLKDANGNPVAGKAVTLAGAPAGTSVSPASATTDASGHASFTITSTTAGSYTYTATDTTDSVTVTQTAGVTFVAGAVTAAQSTVNASPTSVVANGTTTSTVTVTLADAHSNPVAGKTVTLAKSGGSSTITTLSGTTNASGQATFTVKDTTAEQTTYTATDTTDTVTVTQTATVTFTAGTATAAQSTAVASPTSLVADGSTTSTVTVTLKDANSNPVAGKTVTLAKSGGSSTITTVSGTTNASGQATFTVKDTIAESTTYTATDSTDGVTVTQTASVTFTAGTPTAAQSTMSASPTALTADGSSTSTVTVTLKDANGNVVAGKAVSLSGSPSGSSISPASSTTNTSGQASFTVSSSSAGSVTYTATDTTDTVTVTQQATVTYNAGAVNATQSTVSASPASLIANGVSSSTVTVTAKDAFGNPVSGQTVTLAQGTGSSTITTVNGTTNASGQASFTVTDTKAETVTYTATVGSTGVLQTAAVTFTAGTPTAAQSTVAASPTSVTANGTTSSTVTVTLKDANSNPVSGKTVTLGKSGGSSTITTLSGTTNASGQATFTVKDTIAETTTYTATDTTDSLTLTQTATVTFTAGTPTAAQSTAVASPTSVTADGTTTSTITVTLKDANSNPVSGKTVTLAKSGGSSTITTLSGTTNASGQATFTVKDTVAEATTYTATDSTDSVTVTQTATVTFTAGTPTAAQSTLTASPGTVTADGSSSSTATVTLKDANGNVVAGKSVTLAGAPSGTSITPAAATTNASGQATFTITSTTAGSYTYTATDTTDSVTVTQTAGVTFVAGTVSAGASTVAASPTSVVADGSTTSTVTVTLKDANANPVAGKTVTLAKSGGSSTITTLSGTTNASGQATFTVKDTVAEQTTYTATDTTDSLTLTQTATVTFTAGAATAAQSTAVASPTSLVADGSTTSTVTVTLKDANSNPVAGKTVTLGKSGGSSTITTVSGTTNASGQATFTVKDTAAETTTYTATDTTDSVTVGQQPTVTFTAGAVSAGQSTVSASPTALTADGSSTSTVTVTLKDANGNVVAGKAVSLSGSPSGSSISPASSTTNASGQASFTVSSTSAGTVTYTATDTTDTVTVTQQATVTYNSGAVNATQSTVSASASPVVADGSASSTITVTAKDAFGNPVAGQAVTLAQTGSSTVTTVTGTTTAAGVATFTVTDTKAETVTYSATVGAVGILATASVTFTAGPVTAAQSTAAAAPASVTADGSTASTVTVTLNDANANPVAGKTVTLASTGDSSTITTVAGTTDAAGHATFHVTDTVAEGATYTATDTTDTVTVAQHASVTFTPGAATHFTVSAPATASAGTGVGVTVTALDAHDNVATGYTGTVHLTSSDSQAALPADVAASAGVATFTGVTLKTAGTQTVTAADGGVTGTSSSIAVAPAAAASFAVSAPASATAGSSFGATVTAHDAYGNVATGYTGTVHLTSSDARASLPADVAATAGVASFSGVTLKTAGTSTLSAADGSLTGTSGSIAVAAGAAASFTLSAPATATAGTGFGATATAYDAYGNVAAGYTGTVHLTSGDAQAVLPADVAATAGVATFAGVDLRTAGSESVTAADGSVTGSTNVAVSAAAAATFDVSAPATATAGSAVFVTVTARDAYGNVATGYGGTVHLTSSDAQAALPADAAATNGALTFSGVALKTSGSQTVTAADGSVTGTSNTIDVSAASAASLRVAGPATATAGVAGSLTVTAYDAYGNVATGYTGAHPITFSGAASSTSPVTAPTVADDSGTPVAFGSATQLTFTNGVSTAGGSLLLYAAGSPTIAASAPDGGAGATAISSSGSGSLAVTVSAGSFAKLAFALGAAQTNATAFTGVDTLTAEDAYGNTVTTYDAFADNVTISANGALTGAVSGLDGGNALTGSADFASGVADVSGLLTYTGAAGSGTFTATAGTGETGTSGTVTIAAGAAAGFDLTGSSTQTAGQSQSLGLRAVDVSGNTATSYTGDHSLTFAGAGSLGSFAPTVAGTAFGTPATLTFANGAATGSLVLYKVESATISASEGGLATAPADRLAVTVSPDSVSSLDLAAATTTPTAGADDALTITARDAYGNVATGYTGDESLTFAGATAAGSFAPTVSDTSGTPVSFGTPATVRFANGVSSLAGTMKLYTAETATVTVSDGSHGNGAGTAFNVSAAPASSLQVASVNNGSNPTAGVGFPVVLHAVDDYGNRSGVVAATGVSLSTAAGTGSLGGTTTGTIAAGQSSLTVSGVTYTKAESGVRIAADRTSGDTLASGTSPAFTVAATADRLAVTSVNSGSSPTAGQAFSVTVAATDGLGNTSNVGSDTTVTVTLASGTGTLAGTVTATIPAGQSQVTVGGMTYTKAESGVQLRASASGGDSLLAGTSAAFSVVPGPAATFAVAGSATQTAGAPNALTITAYDANGNVATGYTGDHSLTFSGATAIGSFTPTATSKDGSAVDLGSATTVTFANGVSTAGGSLVLYRVQSAHIAAADGSVTTTAPLTVAVSPATATSLSVAAPATSVAGGGFAATVTALDPYGNTDTSYSGTVTLGSGDAKAVLPAGAAAASGVASFTGVRLETAGAQTLTAGDGTLSSGTSVTVTPAAATRLAVAAPGSATAGSGFAVTVRALDPYDNLDTSYSGTVHLSSGDTQATLPADVSASAGVATFTGATLATAGTQTVDAADGTLTGGTTVVVGAAAATHFAVAAPTSSTAGTSFALTATAKDAYGNTDTSYSGSVHLVSSDTHASLPADLAASAGVASFSGVELDTAGNQTVDADDGSLTGSAGVTVGAAAASHLDVAAPTTSTAGSGFAVTVRALDPYDNLDTSYSGTVHLSSGDTQATLPADVAASAGVATFNGARLGTAGSQTLDAGDGSLTGATAVTVSAAAATHFSVAAPGTATAGTGFGATVRALDAFGNLDTSYGGTVHLVSSDTHASLPADLAASAGVASFSGVELDTAGNQTVDANDGSLTGSTGVTVGAASATHFSVSAPASVTAGVGFPVTVTALDDFGNTADGYAGTVQLEGDNSTAASGVASFTGVTLTTAGSQTLAAADGSLTGSTDVTVTPGAAASLAVATSASSAAAGDPLDVVVTAHDAFGNVATGYRGTVALTSNDTRATLGTAHAFAAGDGGSYTFASGVAFGTSGTETVSAGDSTLTGTSAGVDVSAGAAASLVFGVEPADGTAGSLLPSTTVRVVDAFGNLTPSTAALTVAVSPGTGASGATLSGTATRNAVAGVATFDDLSLDKAATGYQLDASSAGLAGAQSTAFAVGAGAADAAHSTLAVAPASVTADGSSAATVTVTAEDAFGNVLHTGGATVTLSTTLGTLSAVTDRGDGTYTAALTSTTAGGATVSGTLNGAALANTGTETFTAGATPSAARSSIAATPTSLTAGGSSTVTVQVRDAFDNDLTAGGATVVLATDLGTLSAVADNGDGTYTATLTSNTAGTAHLSGTINGGAIGTTTSVSFAPGAANAAHSTVSAAPSSPAAGTSSTITVRLKDVYGNALTTGGDDVQLATDLGTLGSVTNNGDGTYTATLTSTAAGSAHVTGTVNGAALTGTTVTFAPAAADASQSTLTASPASLADGSAATVSVHLKDAYGNALSAGGDDVRLATDLGTLSAVADNGDGTYTATLTSTGTGTAHVTGTVNGAALAGATVTFTAGAADASTSSLAAAPLSVTAGSTSTVTVRLRDANGNALTAGGDDVRLATDRGTIGAVTDNGDGTYTATLSSTSAGDAHVSGTVNGAALTGATVTFTVGAADAGHSTLTAAPPSLTAGSSSTVTVQLADAYGNALTTGGDDVQLATDLGTLGSVADNGDDTYTATLASTTSGSAHVTGTVNGAALTGATVAFAPGAANAAHSTVSAAPSSPTAGTPSTITVRLKDVYGNALTTGGDDVQLATDLGTLGSVTDNGDGTYTATLDSTTAGSAHVTGTVNGAALTGTTVTFAPGTADATQSTLTASPTSLAAGADSTVTVRLRDAYGNALTSGGATVTVASDLGTVSAVTDDGDGTYTATLSSTAAGNAHVTATVGGAAISGTTVTFGPAAADATRSNLTGPASTQAGAPATLTVRLDDAYGNALTTGGDDVQLASDLGTVSAVTDNGDGTYTATLTSTVVGTANVTGTVNGAALTGIAVGVTPGAADAATSTLAVSPVRAPVDNTLTVTVRLKDGNGNALTAGGDDVQLATDLGTLGSVVDNGDGSYTATLDSTATGVANVTGTVNGAALTAADATFTAGAVDAAASSLTIAPSPVTAGANATVTVRLVDDHGNAITTGGDDVRLTTDLGTLGAVTDNGDGSYTATLSSTTAGTAHVGGTVDGSALTGTSVTVTAGAADATQSALSASPVATTADGSSTLTVRLSDRYGNTLAIGGDDVRLSTDLGTVGPVTDNGDGTYTAVLASTSTGTAHVGGTVNGAALTGTTVSVAPGAVDAGTSRVSAGASSVSTDAAGTTVTATVKDAHGNPIPGAHVTLAPDGGSSTIDPILGADTDSSGVATFTVADTKAETVVYSATASGTLVTQTAAVQYLPGAANAGQSSIAAAPGSIVAGGNATVTVRLRDVHGNALVSGGDPVAIATDLGAVSSVTDHGDGSYTATLTSTAAGSAHATATLGGAAITGSSTVTVTAAAPNAGQSMIDASPVKVNADGTSGDATLTVSVRDAYANPVSTGGATVALSTTLGTVSSVTDNGDGTYTATLAPNGTAGTATVSGTLGGAAIGGTVDVEMVPPVPTAVIDTAPTGTTATASATLTFHSGNDPNATFECRIDGGSFGACTSPQTYNGIADGAHTFDVRGVNSNGTGTAVAADWTSDVTPPDVALTTAPGAYTNAATEPLAASATDATSGVASVDFLFAANAAQCATGTLISTVTASPYSTTWTLPADGRYTVCAVAHDLAGNTSTAATTDVVVDATKPTITFPALGTLVGSDYWVRGSVDLSTTSFDQTSGVASVGFAYTGTATGTIGTLTGAGTGGTTDPYVEPWDTTTVADGQYVVTATSTDKATNAQDASETLNVDNTPPTASLDDPGAFGHGTIPLSVTASDAGSGVNTAETLVQSSPHDADTWTTIADPTTWTPVDGTYDLRAIVTDNVGNQTITTLRTILVDNTPPIVTNDADSAWHANDVTVTIDAVDDESGVADVEYQVDGGSWTPGTSVSIPAPSDGSNDGTHTITYHATNRAGVTSADGSATVRIDHTPPSNVSLDAPNAGALLHGTLDSSALSGTAQDATSGIASTTFRIAPSGAVASQQCNTFGTPISPPFDTKGVADGTYDMWYVAVDAAGNGRCSVTPHAVTIDNTPPSTTDDAPFAAQNSDVTVHLHATDATSGVDSTAYSVDGGAWTTGDTVTIGAPGDHSNDGTHTIRYHSTDKAGNVESDERATVIIDTTAPAGSADDPNSLLSGTVQLSASPTDADIASVEWLYTPVGSSNWTEIGTDTDSPWELPWITSAVPDGAYDLEAISTDSTGNETTQLFSTKTVDNSPPDSASMTAPNANADLAGTIAFSSTATDGTSGIDTSRTTYQVKAGGDSDFHSISGDHWDSTSVSDGPAEVRVAVWDRAGNGPLYSSAVPFTVDNTAPTVHLGAPEATNGDASLSASGSSDIARVEYDYRPHGGGSWTTISTQSSPFDATWSTNGLPEGLYDVQATATDHGGNTGTDTATVLVDRTAPTVTLSAPVAGTTVGGSAVALSSSASDADSGVASVVYRYRPHGTGSFTTISGSSWDVTSIPSGDYDVQALATDHAGNTSTDTTTVTVDSTPPAVSAFTVASPQHGSVSLHVTTDSTAAKVTYGITPSGGGTAWSQVGASTTAPSFTSSFDTTTVSDGTYDFRAIVSDSLGNETTVDVPNVTIDNTAPSIVSSDPTDGAIVQSADSIVATTSEPVASVGSLELDGLHASFTPTMSGTTLTFPTGTLAPGNHAVTGTLLDAVGNSRPFRINVTVNAGGGATPVTTKNTTDGGTATTLSSADGTTLVTVPDDVWQSAAPSPHDWLVLKVNPSPAPWEIPASNLAMPGSVVDVRLFWDLAGTEEHHFDAPIQIDLNDPSGTSGVPATAEVGASWNAIPQLATAGTLPAGQQDGYWRDGATVHILTRHLSLFTVLVGVDAGSLSSSSGTTSTTTPSGLSTVPPPVDFGGTISTDGLTLHWAPGVPADQVSGFVLYADGKQIAVYGPTTYQAQIGLTSADDSRRFTVAERTTSGATSGPSGALRVVPAVAGLSVDQATAALAGRHFLPGRLVAVPSTAPDGTVVGPTDLQLLPEGSTVDLDVADSTVARAPFAFSVASAPTVTSTARGLAARVALTTRSRIDVTIDAYPYVRIHRFHFFHVPAGAHVLRLTLGHPLKPGQYRLFWKATSDADHTVQRRITPLRIQKNASAPKGAAIVVVSSGRTVQSFAGAGDHLELLDASVEQAFLYATYHEVRGFVLDRASFDAATVKALVAVYPHRAVVVLTTSPAIAKAAKRAGAATLPASATRAQVAALVAKLDASS